MTTFRDTYITKAETISDSATKIIDLKLTDPVTAILVLYQATNGSTSNQQVHIHEDVDKIELVDGADVLFSMSGIEAQAYDFFSILKLPPMLLTEAGSGVQYEGFIIPFGRYIGDKVYYLDPTRFTNPQLKLTHSLTISTTAGFTSGSGKVTVLAKVFQEKPPAPKGFFMGKSIYSWTTAASGDETIELPTDYKLRNLILRAFESGTAWDSSVTNVKLTIDQDKYIPFDIAALDLAYLNEWWYGHANWNFILKETNNDAVTTHLAYPRWIDVRSGTDLDFATYDALAGDKVTLSVTKTTTTPSVAAETADVALYMNAVGVGPHNALAWPFGDLQLEEDWLPLSLYKSAKLKVTQGNAGAAASVILQQLRTY